MLVGERRLFLVSWLCVVDSLFVVSRLVLRWGAKRPQSSRRGFSRQNPMAGFRAASQPSAGQACSPQRLCSSSGIGSPQRVCSPQQTTPPVMVEESRRFCGDCAFWGEPAVCGDCAFCGEPAVCGEFSFCGEKALYGGFVFCSEQACPALGREAAPIQSPRFSRQNPMAGFRAASQPSAGQACSPQKGCVCHQV